VQLKHKEEERGGIWRAAISWAPVKKDADSKGVLRTEREQKKKTLPLGEESSGLEGRSAKRSQSKGNDLPSCSNTPKSRQGQEGSMRKAFTVEAASQQRKKKRVTKKVLENS